MKTDIPKLPYNHRDPADSARQQVSPPKPFTRHVVKLPKPERGKASS